MQRKLMMITGVITVTAALFAAGVSLNTLLLAGAMLLCPAVMYFGMSGMQHSSCHGGSCQHARDGDVTKNHAADSDFKRAA